MGIYDHGGTGGGRDHWSTQPHAFRISWATGKRSHADHAFASSTIGQHTWADLHGRPIFYAGYHRNDTIRDSILDARSDLGIYISIDLYFVEYFAAIDTHLF